MIQSVHEGSVGEPSSQQFVKIGLLAEGLRALLFALL